MQPILADGRRGKRERHVVDQSGDARERSIARLASKQHGVVTRDQLLALGFGSGAITHRLRIGRLHRRHRGVYLLGHPIASRGAREMAAVLACGPSAVISHRSAGALWALVPYPPVSTAIEITVSSRNRRQRPGIRVHRVRLDRDETRRLEGIPITTPARTLLDLATELSMHELERAVADAQARHLATPREMLSLIARHHGRRGTRALRSLFETGPQLTHSEAEARLLHLIRRARLPPPQLNVRLGDYEIDFLWPDQRLIVEVDGFAFHSSRSAFERDRLRDAQLQATGFVVMRVTWRQLVRAPEALVARLSRALAVREAGS